MKLCRLSENVLLVSEWTTGEPYMEGRHMSMKM